MSAHRYWRLDVTTTNGIEPNISIIVDLQMYESALGANVCTGGTASADSTTYGAAANAFDGFEGNSFWGSNAGTAAYLAYDMGSGVTRDVTMVRITPRVDAFYYQVPQGFDVQYSDDGSSWTTSFSVSATTGWESGIRRYFDAGGETSPWAGTASKRFWRLSNTTTQSADVLAVAELEMYAGSGCKGSNLCTGGTIFSKSTIAGLQAYAFDAVRDSATGGSGYWAACKQAAWIGYLFPSAQDITSVAICARHDTFYGQAPKDFVIEYWNGSSFTTAMTLSSITGWTNSAAPRWFDSSGEISEPSVCAPPSTGRPMVFVCT